MHNLCWEKSLLFVIPGLSSLLRLFQCITLTRRKMLLVFRKFCLFVFSILSHHDDVMTSFFS